MGNASDTEDRKQHWEGVYRTKTADQTSWYQARPEPSLELIRRAGVGADAAIIDIGGGASTLVDHLLEAGYRDLTVLDLSGAALDQARRRLGPAANAVNWIEADATEFKPPRRYELWHDRAAFHFLTAAEARDGYRRALTSGLAAGGHAVIATFAPDGPARCSGLEVVRYDAAGLAAELGADFRLLASVWQSHRTPQGREQRFGFHLFERRRPNPGGRVPSPVDSG